MPQRNFVRTAAMLVLLFQALACCGHRPIPESSRLELPDAGTPQVVEISVDHSVRPLGDKRFVPVIKINRMIDASFATAFENRLVDLVVLRGADEVVIEIDSPGGYVSVGFEIASAIEKVGVPTHCVANGEAESMAFYILQSCTDRHMTLKSKLMTHEPLYLSGIIGNRDALQTGIDALAADNEKMTSYEAKRMRISVEVLKERIRHSEWDMDSVEALQVGAIDSVVYLPDYLRALRVSEPN